MPQTSLEIEYKFAVTDLSSLIDELDTLSPAKFKRQYQKSVMYDNNQQIMQITNGRIRVRTLGETGSKQLTYKLPKEPKEVNYKVETEYQVEFKDIDSNIENILLAMGFSPTTSYERYQSYWEINNCHVTIDEYPFQNFIEIEGRADEITDLAEKLGFKIDDGLTDPVDTLFQMWRKKIGLPEAQHLTFLDFDK